MLQLLVVDIIAIVPAVGSEYIHERTSQAKLRVRITARFSTITIFHHLVEQPAAMVEPPSRKPPIVDSTPTERGRTTGFP